jgi:hypothetical protein
MKFTLALLATLVLSGTADLLRQRPGPGSLHSQPKNNIEQEWEREIPQLLEPVIQERIFKDGSEYRYLYDGQILTGLPNVHHQYSGARIRAVVKIQLGEKDLMQIEKVFVGSLHERFVSDPQTLVDLTAFEPMKEQDAPFEEVLRKPVRFSYQNGKIVNFEITEDDPSWSVNMKRAILSTFHLSLTEREEPRDGERKEEWTKMGRFNEQGGLNEIPRKGKTPNPARDDDEAEYFTVIEDSIAGRCEVSYLIMSQPDRDEKTYPIEEINGQVPSSGSPSSRPGSRSPRAVVTDNEPVLNVTKTFDYRHCEFRPFVFRGLHLTSACPTCESDAEDFFDLLESAAHTRYNISGTKEQYIIDSAITEAVYKVTPRSHHAGSLVAYANLTMVLIESGPVKAPINFPAQNPTQIDGLHMINPHFERREGDSVLYESPEADKPMLQKKDYWPNVENKPAKVKVLFEKMVQLMEQKEVTTESALLVQPIMRYLEYAFVEELEQIHQAIKSVNAPGMEKEEIEHLFMDLMVATGTNCTFTYLKRLIVEKKIQGPVVLDVLALLPFKMDIAKISPVMLEEVMDLCEDPAVQSDVLAHRSCWLSFSTLVHKACVHKTFDDEVAWRNVQPIFSDQYKGEGVPRSRSPRSAPSSRSSPSDSNEENLRCPSQLREKIVQKAVESLKSAESEEKRILVIRAMANMALNETVDELAEIIEDDSVPLYIRTQAAFALKPVAPQAPELIYDVLMPVYRDTSKPTQLRIAAYVSIMNAKPALPVLEDIAQSLNREVDIDVASFVYSSMRQMANFTDPCFRNVTRDLLLALELVKPINTDLRHSKSVHYGKYLDQMKRGIFWETNMIYDKEAPVPRSFDFRLQAMLMDKSFDIFEFAFDTEGWGNTLRKYVTNYTSEHLQEVIGGRVPRHPRAANPENQVPDVKEIDSLLPNYKPKEDKELRGTAYIKLFGQTTRLMVINPQTVSRFLVELISQSSTAMPKLTGEGLPMDQRRASTLIDTKVEIPTILGVPIKAYVFAPVTASLKGKLKANVEPKPQEGGFSMLKQAPQRVSIVSDVKTSIAAELHCKLEVYLAFFKVAAGTRTQMTLNAPITGKLDLSLKEQMSKLTMDMPENPIKLARVVTYPVTMVTKMSRNPTATFQPERASVPVPQRHSPGHEDDDSSEEHMPSASRPTRESSHGPRFVNLNISDIDSDMITPNGHVSLSKLYGLPMNTKEIWEIPTPTFVKARKMHLQIGHESMAAKIDLKTECEYPNTEIPTEFLPVVGAKGKMEVRLTPKPGHKKLVITAFQRSITSRKPEKDILAPLKDKMPDITLKDMQGAVLPKDLDKLPKVGHSLQVLINSEGNESPDTWTTRILLGLMYTTDGRYTKVIAGMNSKLPVLPKKFCLTGTMTMPERNNMWFITPQQPLTDKPVQGNLEASWGDECGQEKYLKIRTRLQKSKEQMEIEKNDLYDENGIPVPEEVAGQVREGEALFKSLYKQCEEDRQRGAFFTKECVDFIIKYTDLLRLKFDIEYKNVSRPIRGILHRLERIATQRLFYWNTDIVDVDVRNPENRISGVIEFAADHSEVDIKYQTPHSNVSLINLDLPMSVLPRSAFIPWTYSRLWGLSQPIQCTLTGPKINTYDDNSDEMPLSQCWHVLTKDASEDSLFAVLVAAAGKNSIAKKLAVVFPGHRITIVPPSPLTPSPNQPVNLRSFKVLHNNEELKDVMNPDKWAPVPSGVPEDKEALAYVTMFTPESAGNKEPILAILSPATGVKVFFDGVSVTVMPSPFWKGSLVGLCGIYDGQTWDDKLLPNKTMAEGPEELSRAFLLPTPGCDSEIPEIPSDATKTNKPSSRRTA